MLSENSNKPKTKGKTKTNTRDKTYTRSKYESVECNEVFRNKIALNTHS